MNKISLWIALADIGRASSRAPFYGESWIRPWIVFVSMIGQPNDRSLLVMLKFRKKVKCFQNAETMSLCIYLNQTNHRQTDRQTDRQTLRTLLHRHLVSHDRVLWQRARTSPVGDIVGTLAMQRRVHSTWHQRRRQKDICNNIHSVYHVPNFMLRYDTFHSKATLSAPHISTAVILFWLFSSN